MTHLQIPTVKPVPPCTRVTSMFVSSRDFQRLGRAPDVVINGDGGSLLPQSAAAMRFSSSKINQHISNPLDGIIGTSFQRPSLSDDIAYQIAAHRVQKVVPPVSLPSASTTKSDNLVLYHAVDNGDLAFTIRRRLEADPRATGNNFYAKQDRFQRAPHGPIVNLATVNYILRGLQTDMGDNTANWESFLWDTGWPADKESFKLSDFHQGRTQHRNVSMFIQDYIRPLGVVVGSDKQGGQHQGSGAAVDAPVDFVVTILVDGMCDSLRNLWRRTDIRAGDDLLLVLCGCALRPHGIQTTGIRRRVIQVPEGPMGNQFSLNGEGIGVNAKTFVCIEPHTTYVLNHWTQAAVEARFSSAPDILYELVPTTSSEISEGSFLGDDRRNRGLWHVARSQMQTFGASAYNNARGVQAFRNDSANLQAGVCLVQSTVSPVWKSAAAAHRRTSPKQTVVHTTNHVSNTVYTHTSVMTPGASLGSVLRYTSTQDLVSILTVSTGTSVSTPATTGSVELVRMFKLQTLMLASVKSWEKFVSQVRQDTQTESTLKNIVKTMQDYGKQTIQFYTKGMVFEFTDIVCAQEYDDFLVWLNNRHNTTESMPVTLSVGPELGYTSWIFNFYSFCSAWSYLCGKTVAIDAITKILDVELCQHFNASTSVHDIAIDVVSFCCLIMSDKFEKEVLSYNAGVQRTEPGVEKTLGHIEKDSIREGNMNIITSTLNCQVTSPVTKVVFVANQTIDGIKKDPSITTKNYQATVSVLTVFKSRLLHVKDVFDTYTPQFQALFLSEKFPPDMWGAYKHMLNLYCITPPANWGGYGPFSYDIPKFEAGAIHPACRTALMSIVVEDIGSLDQMLDKVECELKKLETNPPAKLHANPVVTPPTEPIAKLHANPVITPPTEPIDKLPRLILTRPKYLSRGGNGVLDNVLTSLFLQKRYESSHNRLRLQSGGQPPVLKFLINENKATTMHDILVRIPEWRYTEAGLYAALEGLESKQSCIVKELKQDGDPGDTMNGYTYTVGPQAKDWIIHMANHQDSTGCDKEESFTEHAEMYYKQCTVIENLIEGDLLTYETLSLRIKERKAVVPWDIVAECIDISDDGYDNDNAISDDGMEKLALKWTNAIASGKLQLINAKKITEYLRKQMQIYKGFLASEELRISGLAALTSTNVIGSFTPGTFARRMNHIDGLVKCQTLQDWTANDPNRRQMKRVAESAPDNYDSTGNASTPPPNKRGLR
jgi:hypothetical protein